MASRETQAIIDFVKAAGVPHRVTGIVGTWKSVENPCSPHTASSLHCAEGTGGKGLAVDFGGSVPGVTPVTVAEMTAIWHLFEPQAPKLKELFFNGSGLTRVVKNGVWRDGLTTLGPTTWTAHKTHLHVAVGKGTFLTPPVVETAPPTKRVYPMYAPPLVIEPIVADLACPAGGAWCLAASGAIYGFGGAPHKGAANGQSYFEGRKAARLEPNGSGYAIVSESGERYQFP